MENKFRKNEELQFLINQLGLVEVEEKEAKDDFIFSFSRDRNSYTQLSFLQ